MDDLIRRQAAIDAIKTWGLIDGLSEGEAIEILSDEEKLPSITSQQRIGHWINYKDEHRCSRCKEAVISNHLIWDDSEYGYCPNCGCLMVEPQESENKE